jgi:type IV pilus assembly protein PilB
MKFGKYLLENKVMTNMELMDVLDVQKYTKQKLGRICLDFKMLSKSELDYHLTAFFKVDYTDKDLKDYVSLINNEEQYLNHSQDLFLILENTVNKLIVLGSQVDDELLREMEQTLDKDVTIKIIKEKDFQKVESLLDKSFHSKDSGVSSLINDEFLSSEDKLKSNGPYQMILRECLEFSVNKDASDIHIEPQENGLLIKVRILGELIIWKKLELDHREYFIKTCKDILNLDLSIVGKPQDSRASFEYLGIDLRVNSLPIIYGEKIVLRILNQKRQFSLSALEFDEKTKNCLHKLLKLKNGLILISGPTGSGKTTTLYSLINGLDATSKNISTLENPVEYRLEGINQVDIGSSKNLGFETCLRALMRQDPDIILIGEIRDYETAMAAFKAASTGHLVFSTVHANGPVEVVDRLLNLGVDQFTIKSNLVFSAAQRLLRKLCPGCSRKICNPMFTSSKTKHATGCNLCQGGISGRIPILSFLEKEQVDKLLNNLDFEYQTLKQIALKYADTGIVSVDDALEVA